MILSVDLVPTRRKRTPRKGDVARKRRILARAAKARGGTVLKFKTVTTFSVVRAEFLHRMWALCRGGDEIRVVRPDFVVRVVSA